MTSLLAILNWSEVPCRAAFREEGEDAHSSQVQTKYRIGLLGFGFLLVRKGEYQ